jgi:hypothetical protein
MSEFSNFQLFVFLFMLMIITELRDLNEGKNPARSQIVRSATAICLILFFVLACVEFVRRALW